MFRKIRPVYFVLLVDYILLNSIYFTLKQIHWDTGATHGWFVLNICFTISILLLPAIAQKRMTGIDKVMRRSFWTTVICFAIYGIYVIIDARHNADPFHFMVATATTFVLIFLGRAATRAVFKFRRSLGFSQIPILFVGSGHNLAYLHACMSSELSHGYKVMGYFDTKKTDYLPKDIPYLGTIQDIEPWLAENHPLQIYCNLPSSMGDDILRIIQYCESNFIRFFSVPNVRNYLHRAMEVQMIDDMPVLTLRQEPLSHLHNVLIKRTFDIIVSSLFITLCFWWICIIVAIITKTTMPGPVFFRQRRNGHMGKEFWCYKFRSMKINADSDNLQATKGDPRVTRWGHIMRKTSIDELPQFINVLLGDMSVVGPRPHMVKHTEEYSALISKYMVRHWVKPGVTGWAQVKGCRGETEHLYQMEERIAKDVWYIENWTIWLDIRIIYLTIRNGLFGDKQAY